MPRIIRRRRIIRRKARKPYLRRRKARMPRTLNPMADRARVVEVQDFGVVSAGQGIGLCHALNQFPRALNVAKNFRFYRCTKVELEFIPFANVFSNGQSFPELYYQVDKTWTPLATQAPTKTSMEVRGVLPLKWTAPIKRSYKPSVLRQENLITAMYKTNDGNEYYLNDAQPVSATPVNNKWYMTEVAYLPSQQPPNGGTSLTMVGPSFNPAALIYHGCAWYINTPVVNPNVQVGRVVVRVHWEFKQPRATPSDYPTPSTSSTQYPANSNIIDQIKTYISTQSLNV